MSEPTNVVNVTLQPVASTQHGFWYKVLHGAATVFLFIPRKFAALFGDDPEVAVADATAMAKLMWAALKSAPGQIAQAVVAHLATPEFEALTNAQKREEAISTLITEATAKGIELAETDAVLLTQYAYAFFAGKLKLTDTDPTPTGDTITKVDDPTAESKPSTNAADEPSTEELDKLDTE